MKMKTDQLIGPALDWAVAKCEGLVDDQYSWLYQATLEEVETGSYHPSTNGCDGMQIIEREKITVAYVDGMWVAATQYPDYDESTDTYYPAGSAGQTPLIAAMRCFVNTKLGTEVEIPKELLK